MTSIRQIIGPWLFIVASWVLFTTASAQLINPPFEVRAADANGRSCAKEQSNSAHAIDRTLYSAFGPRDAEGLGSVFHPGVDYCRQKNVNDAPLIHALSPVTIDYIYVSPTGKGGNVLFITNSGGDTFGLQHIFSNLAPENFNLGVRRGGLALRRFKIPASLQMPAITCWGIFGESDGTLTVLVDRTCTTPEFNVVHVADTAVGENGLPTQKTWQVRKQLPAGHWLAPVGNSATIKPHLHVYYKSQSFADNNPSHGLCTKDSPCKNPLSKLTHPNPQYSVTVLKVNTDPGPLLGTPRGYSVEASPTSEEKMPPTFPYRKSSAPDPRYKLWIDVDFSLGHFSNNLNTRGQGYDLDGVTVTIKNLSGVIKSGPIEYKLGGGGDAQSPAGISPAACKIVKISGEAFLSGDCKIASDSWPLEYESQVIKSDMTVFAPPGNDATSKKHLYFLTEIPQLEPGQYVLQVQPRSVSAANLPVAQFPFAIENPTHWAATYSILPNSCTRLPPVGLQWYWQNPCNAYLPVPGNSGAFYFDDVSTDVIFESSQLGYKIRSIASPTPAWRSTSNIISHSIPTAFIVDTVYRAPSGSNVPRTITESSNLSFTFTVTSRSANLISGTFKATMRSGYFNNADTMSEWFSFPTESTGSWQANLVNLPLPNTQMKGFDFCADVSNSGNRQMEVPSSATNPDIIPSWATSWVANGCVYR